MLNLNFLRFIVIILAIAILSLFTIIVIKIMNGDISKSESFDSEKNILLSSKEIRNFELTIPINSDVEKIFADANNIILLTQNKNEQSFVIISSKKNIEVIKIINGENYYFEEVKN